MVVPIIFPEQLSEAVGGVKLATVVQREFTVGKLATLGTGAVKSLTETCCVWVDVFPFPSLYVQVIVVFELIGKLAELVAVMVPAQLSVAVGAVKEVTAQEELIAGRVATFGTGAVLSPACTT